MWLIIDDKRDLNCEVVARTAEAGKWALKNGSWECLCLDHDLGIGETGYDVLKWAIENKCLPDRVQLVTDNSVGLLNMAATLESNGFTRLGLNFHRKSS